ncbi:L-aspartate oxidase [Bacillus sp. Marseille-P3661]|uniref:L-aspartate oxidase n=1 Tax=Bacillus sp. Marseille-P3661 TaxID=1936234 RepID=UPI000C82BA40|nr:FAD-dependent oxidoreductase [Bacillus sp. Marseille-P3661]
MQNKIRIIETDILVIGSGGAGLSSAVYAAQSGQSVLVIDKGVIGRSGNTVGAVQIAGAGQFSVSNDSTETYFEDIIESGRGLANPELVSILVNNVEHRVNDLVQWGLKLEKEDNGNVKVYTTPGHRHPRGISAKNGNTGFNILKVLIQQAKKLANINRWNDVIVVRLVKNNERVAGAVVYDLVHCEWAIIKSNAVVLATGGIGQLYPTTSNPIQATGDGFSLALQAGVSLLDMEQVQFYPVSLVYPESIAGFCISFYHLAKLYNSDGERFMERYDPENLENVTRDTLAQAIDSEIKAGRGTEHNGVWLDVTHCAEKIKKEHLHEYNLCLKMGLDLTKDRVEVGPASHFIMGGVHTDTDTATNVAGLFVAGETAGGLHGGNRLVNNAIAECVVFGARAGLSASAFAQNNENNSFVDPVTGLESLVQSYKANFPFNEKGIYRPFQIKERIRSIMGQYVGVRRDELGLLKAQEELDHVQQMLVEIKVVGGDQPLSRDVLDYFEVSHMIETAKAIIGSALLRQESRGAQYRLDYPKVAENIQHTTVTNVGGRLQFMNLQHYGGLKNVKG